MAHIPSTSDIALLTQRTKTLYAKVDLLDENMITIDQLEGVTVSGSIDIDADSDIRRTYSSQIVLDKNHAIQKYSEDEWLNKYIRVYIGVKDHKNEITWYPCGLYVISQNGFVYNETSRTLNLQCVDLVSKLNDTLAGQLTGFSTEVKEGQNIRNAIISTVQLAGFNKFMIDYLDRTVPYDLEYDTGTTVWNILQELRDLYYPFEMYFDDDTFVCKEIPSGYEDPVIIDHEVFDKLVVSEDATVDYSQVRNCVEVFGKSNDADYYSDTTTYSDGIYTLNTTDAETTKSGKFSFLSPVSNPFGTKIKIVNTVTGGEDTTIGPFELDRYTTDEDGDDVILDANTMYPNKYYVVKYDKQEQKFYFIGQAQTHAMVMLVDKEPTDEEIEAAKIEENCDNLKFVATNDSSVYSELYGSRLSIDRIGRRNKVLSGGDYENYTSDQGCMEVAEYEHWKRCRLTDLIQVTMLIVPWLEVNQKISYTAKYLHTDKPVQFIVKKITMSLGEGTMSVTLSRFYPFYPFIVENTDQFEPVSFSIDEQGRLVATQIDNTGYTFSINEHKLAVQDDGFVDTTFEISNNGKLEATINE